MAEFQAFHQTHSFRRDNFRKDEDWSGRQSHICYRIFTIEYLQQTCQRRCPERDSAFFSFADEISVLRLMEIAIPPNPSASEPNRLRVAGRWKWPTQKSISHSKDFVVILPQFCHILRLFLPVPVRL